MFVLLMCARTVKEAEWKGNGSCSHMDTHAGNSTTLMTDVQVPFHVAA